MLVAYVNICALEGQGACVAHAICAVSELYLCTNCAVFVHYLCPGQRILQQAQSPVQSISIAFHVHRRVDLIHPIDAE